MAAAEDPADTPPSTRLNLHPVCHVAFCGQVPLVPAEAKYLGPPLDATIRRSETFMKRHMEESMKREFNYLTAIAVLLLTGTLTGSAYAQTAVDQTYLGASTVATNVAAVHAYPDTPQGFNPLTASDQELASYGFPTRPDPQSSPDHYALWARAMAAAKLRWHGDLTPMNIGQHRTQPTLSREVTPAATATGPAQWSNVNAAGVILNNTLKTFGKGSFDDIWTTITVPVVQNPFDNTEGCTTTDYITATYAGFDGGLYYAETPYFYPGELAGVVNYVTCTTGQQYHYATVGWSEIFYATFQVNPGDIFYTEIHAFGGCNAGSAFVEDLTTLTYNSYSVSNPCLTPQVGKSANWVVDRGCCDGPNPIGVWPLGNTIQISFEGASVLNGNGKSFYPGSQATTTQVMTMTDDGGDQAIELVSQGSGGSQGLHSLSFSTTGCAFTGGCVP
jgi:hypothetical protein